MAKKRKKHKSKHQKKKSRNRNNLKAQNSRSAISLCMIVKNEENFLPGCLESVSGLVEEMVVVDTGSSDSTLKIAEKAGAKVYQFEWQDDFAKARNFAVQKCTSPWILYLDADERLPKEHHQTILKAVQSNKADAFYIKVKSEVSGVLGDIPHVQAYPRLFKKLPGAKFEGKIHEQITPALKRINAKLKKLNATIEHLGYSQNDDVLRNKINRNIQYLERQVNHEPNNVYALFQLGQTYLLDQQTEKGKELLQKALKFDVLPQNLKANILLILANESFKEENYREAIETIDEAITIAPNQQFGYFLKSECYAKQNQWESAVKSLEKVLENINEVFSDISVEKNFEPYLIYQRMAVYLFYLERYEDSLEYFEKYFYQAPSIRVNMLKKWAIVLQSQQHIPSQINNVLKYLEGHSEPLENLDIALKTLSGIAEKVGDVSLMKQFLEKRLQINTEDEETLYYLGNIELQQGNYSSAEELYQKALSINEHVWEVHYNLAVCRIKQYRYQHAIDVLENALNIFPEKLQTVQRLLGGLYAKLGIQEKAQQKLSSVINQ